MKFTHYIRALTFAIVPIILFAGCGQGPSEVIYDYSNFTDRDAALTKDCIIGKVDIHELSFKSERYRNIFDNLFNEITRDTLSQMYYMVIRVQSDTMLFAIQNWSYNLLISYELKEPGYIKGILPYKIPGKRVDFFVLFDTQKNDEDACNKLFNILNKKYKFELRRHMLPSGIALNGSCTSQIYSGSIVGDSLVYINKRERNNSIQ